MSADTNIELRPRSTGEILDDAWRLALAAAPSLLALSGLFLAPTLAVLLVLLTRPTPETFLGRCALPALAALLIPLTGVGSGACQEYLRRRGEEQSARISVCLKSALRRAPLHMAARIISLAAVLGGALFMIVPGLGLWSAVATVHALLCRRETTLFRAVREAAEGARRQPGKATAVVVSRIPLVLLAFVNVHIIVQCLLFVAGSMMGLEVAFLDFLLALENPAYVFALGGCCWLFLTPYFEASNFLLSLDNRVRFEGEDLSQRVRTLFPAPVKTSLVALLLTFSGLLLSPVPARADDDRLTTVRAVRKDVQQLTKEIKEVEPYPRDGRYQKRLTAMAERLPDTRWFKTAIEGFGQRDRDGALDVLANLDQKLAVLEESLTPEEEPAGGERLNREELRKRIPGSEPNKDDTKGSKTARAKEKEEREEEQKVRENDPKDDQPKAKQGGGGGALPNVGFNPAQILWVILGGILLAVLIVALVLYLRNRGSEREKPPQTGVSAPSPEAESLEVEQQTVSELWRQAEEQARKGNHRKAVRFLYLAVLTLLHRADLIHFEKTRTNNEYLRQLWTADGAGELLDPFGDLTRLFEMTWYGERECRAEDYDACRELATRMRADVKER
jgi:Domain of unknown function (DUF4129)